MPSIKQSIREALGTGSLLTVDNLIKIIDFSIIAIISLLLFLSLVFPVFAYPDSAVFYKTTIFAAGILFLLSNKFLKEEKKIETPLDTYFFILFVFITLLAITSINKVLTLNSISDFFTFLLFYYLVYNYARTNLKLFLMVILSLGALLSLYAFYQYLSGFEDTLKNLPALGLEHFEDIKYRLETKRVFSTLIYPNAFAGLLIMILPLSFAVFKANKRLRPLSFILAAILLVALFLTQSVGAFISLGLSIFVVLLLSRDPALKNFRLISLSLFTIILAGLLLILKLRGIDGLMSDFSGRLANYSHMFALIKNRLLFGYGPGTFEVIYNSALPAGVSYLKYAHNVLFQMTLETGIIGAGLFLITALYGFSTVFKNFYFLRYPSKKVLVISLVTGICAFLIHNLVDFDVYNFELALVFTFVLAILMSQINIGIIELNKLKLSFFLGVNPSKRRSIILFIVLAVLLLSCITGGKQYLVLTSIELLIAAGFAIWTVSKENIRVNNLNLPVSLFLSLLFLSLTYTVSVYAGISYFVLVASASVLFFVSYQFLKDTSYKIILGNYIIWLGVALSFVGILQLVMAYIAKQPLLVDGFFPNKNLFAGFMVVPFSFLLSRLLFEKIIKNFPLKVAGLFLFIFIEGVSQSKGGILSMLFSFLLIYIYYTVNKKMVKDQPAQQKIKTFLIQIMAAIIIVSAFTGLTVTGQKMITPSADKFVFNRLGIWKSSLLMIKDKPLTGYGIGSYERIFPKYNFPAKAIARYQMGTPFAHNELLQIGATVGLGGMVLAIFIAFILLKNITPVTGHRKLWAATTGAYFAIVALFFHSIFDFNLHNPGTLFIFAILAAIVVNEKALIQVVPKNVFFLVRLYYFPALLVFFIIITFLLRVPVAKYYYADYMANSTYSSLYSAHLIEPYNSVYLAELGSQNILAHDYKKAVHFFERALKFDSRSRLYNIYLARTYTDMRAYKDAERYYKEAIKCEPFFASTYVELADFYYNNLNDSAAATTTLLKAIDLEPNYVKARNNLAILYREQHRPASALFQYDAAEVALETLTPTTAYEKEMFSVPKEVLYFNKANALTALKRTSEACYYFKKSYTLSHNPHTLALMSPACSK